MSLDDRLRDAAAELRSAAGTEPATRPTHRRPLLLVAALIVVVVLVAALATRPDHDGRVVTDDPRPTTPSTFDPHTPPTSEATAAVYFDNRWYAAGTMFNQPPDGWSASPVVWASDDGTHWERVWRNESGVALGSGAVPSLFVAGGRLLMISVGTGGTAVWWSEDGTRWFSSDRPGTDWFRDGTWFHGRFVAAGEDKTASLLGRPGELWATKDDNSWSPIATDLPGVPWFDHLVADADELVLAGHATRDDGAPAVVWRSSDGRQWSDPVALGEGPGTIFELAFGGGTAVATVGRPEGPRELWVSTAGAAWRHIGDSPFGSGGSNTVTLLALGDELVFHGFVGVGEDGVLRRSADGITWTAVATSGSAYPTTPDGIAVHDGAAVILQHDDPDWRSQRVDLGG